MDKTKDNQTEKLLGEIYKAFDMLHGPLQVFEAFKIIFALLYYKRFNDILEKSDEFEYLEPADVSAECLLPEENRWNHLLGVPPHQIFLQIGKNISEIACLNEKGSLNLEGIGEALSFQTYQSKIPLAIQHELINLFNSQDLSFREIPYRRFEEVVMKFESKCRNNYETNIHPSLNKLMMGILNPLVEEYVYSPYCGFGEVFNRLIDHMYGDQNFVYEQGNYCIGLNVQDLEILALVKLRLSTALISNAKLMKEYKRLKPLTICNFDEKVKADVIFLNPPFGQHIPVKLLTENSFDSYFPEIPKKRRELFELLLHLQGLSDHGRMSVVVPFGVLFSGGKVRNVREFLTGNDYLEAVIQLPESMFSRTTVKTALLVINKNKSKARKHKVLFAKVEPAREGDTVIISDEEINRVVNTYNKAKGDIDAMVTLEEIQQQDYDLSPGRYIGAFLKELEKLVEDGAAVDLDKISKIIKGKSKKPDPDDNNGLPFITTKDLARDIKDPIVDLTNVDVYKGTPKLSSHVFSTKCILVSHIGNDLKPTIFDPEHKYYKYNEDSDKDELQEKQPEILLGNNIAAIIPDEEIVDFEYLYYQLYSPIVKKQFDATLAGAGIPHTTLTSFKKIVIPVLKSLTEQYAFIRQQKSLLFEAENAKLELVKTKLGIPEIKQEAEYEIVQHLAHNIKPKINIVRSPIMAIYDFLEKENLLDKVVSTGMDSSKETARGILDIANEGLSLITNALDSAGDIVTREIKKNEFQKTNIFDLFENRILPFYKNKTYNTILDCDDKDIEAYLHIDSFKEAINNIMENAEMHAFPGNTADPVLRFEINEDINEKEIIIDYTNNGHPLPTSVSEDVFLSIGKKSINSKGKGLGGAWIKKVIEAHNGSFEIIRDDNPVHFRLKFPQ